jgi:hypothetical protein
VSDWSDPELATLVRIKQQAGRDRREFLRLAKEALPERRPQAVLTKIQRLQRKDRPTRPTGRPPGRPAAHSITAVLPPTVPLELAPKVCSHCGGRWRLEDDLMAGKRLICTVCATDMFVY